MPHPVQEPAATPNPTSDAEVADAARYSRQTLFPGIGIDGQRRLLASRVAIVGVGATGAATATLLARAGVGFLRLIDRDFVEPSNLQRQILFDEADAEAVLPKALAAARKLALLNSGIRTEPRVADLTPAEAPELLGAVDLILDATDNFETRFLINDFSVLHGIPWIYAGAVGAAAVTMNVLPRALPTPGRIPSPRPYQPTACLACLFPEPPRGDVATCDTAGILAGAVNLAASIQSVEALKLLTGQPQLMRRTLLSFDLWPQTAGSPSAGPPSPSAQTASPSLTHAELDASTPDPDCAVCSHGQLRFLTGEQRPQITLCGRNAVQIHERGRPLVLADLHARLARLPELTGLRSNELLLRFHRGGHTVTLFHDGRAVIQGTTDPHVARSLYARFIGA